jgi:cell wall-associated NlpC family hydrolase
MNLHLKSQAVIALVMAGVSGNLAAPDASGGASPQVPPMATAATRAPPAAVPHDESRPEPTPGMSGGARPAMVGTRDLAGFASLPAARQALIEAALAVATHAPWLPYRHGGADPALGGLDCSGAMYFVLTQCGLSPPRTSAGQYGWLRDHHQLHLVAEEATTAEDPSLAGLQPGDLLFWATGHPAEPAKTAIITHVAMYLGRELTDGLQIMINATDGRSYRGTKADGYGVYDFSMPRATSLTKLVGYGPPPGMAEMTLKTPTGGDGGSGTRAK